MIRKAFVSSLVVGVTIFSILVLNILFPETQCSLRGSTQAQSNPCLEQEATITALELRNLSLEATMSAMSAVSATEAAAPEQRPTDNAPVASASSFTERFDNNNRGWNLGAGDNYSISISRGSLNLTVRRTGTCVSAGIPNVNINSVVRVEVDVVSQGTDRSYNSGFVGFIITDESGEDRKYMLLGKDRATSSVWRSWSFRVWTENQRERFVILADNIYKTVRGRESNNNPDNPWNIGQPFKMAFEVQGSIYTLYHNRDVVESISVSPNDARVGLAWCGEATYPNFSWSGSDYVSGALFDNVVVTTTTPAAR